MENAMNYHISKHFPTLRMRLSNGKDYKQLLGSSEKTEGFHVTFLSFTVSLYKKLNSRERHSGPYCYVF